MRQPAAIFSIQSSVAYGHVGNSAAVFPLQRLGFEVWPVNTVYFSNHTGYGAWRGSVLELEMLREIVLGIEERGVFGDCGGVLSGYLGDASLGRLVLEILARVRAVNPNLVYCCDPVMGDAGRGFFVRPGIPEFMRSGAVPAATIVTPNQFELEYLAGMPVTDLASALRAVEKVQALGPEIVLVTSFVRTDGEPGTIELLAADRAAAYLITTPKLDLSVNGAGDATAAIFFGQWIRSKQIDVALSRTTNAIFQILSLTHAIGSREIQLIAGQDAIANPPDEFQPVRIR
jgi:pyridoxine kinase